MSSGIYVDAIIENVWWLSQSSNEIGVQFFFFVLVLTQKVNEEKWKCGHLKGNF